ncbi:MAG TPA: hypothetical protein VN824_16485, partial [Puia sp.]|nr:hypothetical protein [Puia sp.]
RWISTSGSSSGSINLDKRIDNLGLDRLDSFNYSKVFNNTYIIVFLTIATISGFMLLDMYLQQKRKQTT